MKFLVSYCTDKGIKKDVNQDSFCVKLAKWNGKEIIFVAICDGMGGLSDGELASASVIRAFSSWFDNEILQLLERGISLEILRERWEKIIFEQNKLISTYGKNKNKKLGTTVVCFMGVEENYYIANVGDSRAYEIYDSVKQITKDHTLIAREIELGNITEEEAKQDSRKNILLQCVGASEKINVDFFVNRLKKDSSYLLCSDGFRNKISKKEIYKALNPNILTSNEIINLKINELIEISKSRKEKDNITAVLVKTY
ncbi:MAG: PP2C family serine/threonine-protein phosphatase [Clostridium sp.]|nr:PP2C family serine/threonine-protein phosphatase [Clostridium sp.]